jgi:DNA-directed RNA polymerase subunit H (RpoH/RPB5)
MYAAGDASFGKQQAESVIAYMHANGISRLFLVTGSPVTPPAQKLLESAVHVEYWPVTACLSAAESHQTVPRCRKLTAREKRDFYAQNGLSAANLPRMLVTDRMSKYWDFVPGDVVELERHTHVGVVKGEMRVVTHN